MRRPLSFALIGLLSYSACVLAAEPVAGPQISLSAQARQTVANDQALAVLYAEASSANPQQVVDELNRQGQRALAIAKGYRQVRIASGNRSTWPVYDPNDKEHRNQPTGWRGMSRAARSSGCKARPAGPVVRCRVEPLVHRRPKLAGCAGSPRTPTMRLPSC